jgi:hypothetical protein
MRKKKTKFINIGEGFKILNSLKLVAIKPAICDEIFRPGTSILVNIERLIEEYIDHYLKDFSQGILKQIVIFALPRIFEWH